MQYTINVPTANVRAGPGVEFPILGGLRLGDAVWVGKITNGWALISVQLSESQKGWIGIYVRADLLKPVDVPATPESSVPIGVNVLGDHRQVVNQLLRAKCPSYVIFQAPDVASYVKDQNPNAIVLVRPWLDGQVPTVDRYLNLVGGAKDPRLIYLGFNEGDELNQNNPTTIAERAKRELEFAKAVKAASGATYAAGSWSVGNPDVTNKSIAEAITAVYREPFRRGDIWMDHHLYSPDIQHIDRTDDLQWYETRIQKYYQLCDFDPDSAGKWVCSETGEDEGGIGGFVQHNRTSMQVIDWARKFAQAYARPITSYLRTFKIPLVCANIFAAAGGSEKWKGYDFMQYVPTFGEAIWTVHG